MARQTPLYLGVDIGGTHTRVALGTAEGAILARETGRTPSRGTPESVVREIAGSTRALLERARVPLGAVVAAGAAAAGTCDRARGVIVTSPNLPTWHNVPLRALLEKELGIPIVVINDAKAAALGEWLYGAGRGTSHMVYVTVSTGIGSGLVLNGRLYEGVSGSAGEVGHIILDPQGPLCACGNRGCLEAFASGTAIAREAAQALRAGRPSLLREMAGGHPEAITAWEVGEAARRGDTLAREVIERAVAYLGLGLAALVNLLNPERIVLGGGVARMGDLLFEPLRRAMKEHAFELPASAVELVPWTLDEDVGVLGAIAIAHQTYPGP